MDDLGPSPLYDSHQDESLVPSGNILGIAGTPPSLEPGRRPRSLRPAPAGSQGPDALGNYLRSIRGLRVLTREETNELATEIATQEAAFREAMADIPGTALRAVERWQERKSSGHVTGLLCHGYRDDPSRDWSGRIDRILSSAERLLAERSKGGAEAKGGLASIDAKLAKRLREAELHFDVLREIHLEFVDLLKAPRNRSANEARRRVGLHVPAARAAVERAKRALELRDESRSTFASHNLRLVIKLSKRYRGLGVPFEDLIQDGNLGLMRAVEKFDPSRGFRFSTYAVWWIEQAMIRAVQNHSRTVRVPSHMYDAQLRYRRAEQSLRARLAREPEREDLARELEISNEELEQVSLTMKPLKSLDARVGDDESTPLGDLMADESDEDPSGEVDRETLRRAIEGGLRRLSARERSIIEWRFGLRGEQELTLHEIGKRVGLSRERVRQIQADALARLRSTPAVASCADGLDAPRKSA